MAALDGYESAVAALLSPIHQATPDTIEAASARRRNTLLDMNVYMTRLGIDLNDGSTHTRVIHVTGTKGKGSTLAFCESICRKAYNMNTGLFTSPHLVTIRERIRINGVPLSKAIFGKVYWKVRRKLETHKNDETQEDQTGLPPLPIMPGYFRMLTLMAIYAFCHHTKPKLDVILMEVGMGGRYDATNVFDPSCSAFKLTRGVTVIDYDHTRVLGSTLEQIAWEKAGIYVRHKGERIGMNDGGYEEFNKGSTTGDLEVDQRDWEKVFASKSNSIKVLDVLKKVANENHYQLETVDDTIIGSTEIGIRGNHQRSNAALAISLCRHATKDLDGKEVTENQVHAALSDTFWPGRCQTLSLLGIKSDVSITMRCDGAHTPISTSACINWFNHVTQDENIRRILLFNCSHERNPIPLLYTLYTRVSAPFESVYFCRANFERPSHLPKLLNKSYFHEQLSPNNEGGQETGTMANYRRGHYSCYDEDEFIKVLTSSSSWQKTLSNIWEVFAGHHEGEKSYPVPIDGLLVKDALEEIKREATSSKPTEILVTGSLYLVGSALEAADWQEGESIGEINTNNN